MQAVSPFKEGAELILEEGGEALKQCYQCGLCSATCPWSTVRTFLVRRLMHQGQLGVVDFEDEDVWQCATCKACVERCPRGVEIIDVMKALRRVITEVGVAKVPDSLRITVKNISGVGNPLGEAPEKRVDWAKKFDVKLYTKGTEWLYIPCCIPAYDPGALRVAQATASVLKKVGADFGVLDASEVCCGESVRKAGNESLFQTLAEGNINAFAEAGAAKVITSSPHCYYTFREEYPKLGATFEVVHFTQYLAGLIKEGKLKFTREIKKKVAYHDPCYLGRHSGVYDEPREVLKSIPGLELVEMPNYRDDSFCCGGGGGRIWMESKKGERLSDIRVEQALEVGAEIMAIACPYCLLNFDDSVLTMDKGSAIQIKDIAELVDEAI